MRLYESMFLVDNARAKEDVDGITAELQEMVTRTGGEVVNVGKWDERKLTYEINRQRRGTYVLCHWNGPADAPARLERQCQLSEMVLRVLTLRDEDGTEIKGPREEARSKRDWDRGRGRDRDRDRHKDRPRKDRDRGKGKGKPAAAGKDRGLPAVAGKDRSKDRDTEKDKKDNVQDQSKDQGEDQGEDQGKDSE